jgi:hypothetical protein
MVPDEKAFTVMVPRLDLEGAVPEGLERVADQTQTLLRESLSHQQRAGALTKHVPFGGAVLVKVIRKKPGEQVYGKLAELVGNPERMFDFAFAWDDTGAGDELAGAQQIYGYYALCKMRPVARTGKSTAELIDLRKQGDDRFEQNKLVVVEIIDGVVEPPEERVFGDFDHKGAVVVENEDYYVLVGVSGFSEDQDHLTAEHVAGYVLLQLSAAS